MHANIIKVVSICIIGLFIESGLVSSVTIDKKDLLFKSGFDNQQGILVPNVEPVQVDDTIVCLIQRLDEELIRGFIENLTSFGPRRTGTKACERSAEYIYNEFVQMGLTTRYQDWGTMMVHGTNIEATIHGYDDTDDDVYIICAHYDSFVTSPGADDDGSGVAAVMAAAKVMRNYLYKYTIKFVAFSGEEQGLYGSLFYVQEAQNNNVNIAGVLNIDAIGYAETEKDTILLNVYQNTYDPDEWLTNYTINVSEEYHDYINLDIVPSGYFSASDHYNFWTAGYNAIWYLESTLNPNYHSPQDTIDKMDLSYAVKNTQLIIATLAELAEISELQAPLRPVITNGPSTGKAGESYMYSASTLDPQNDNIYYLWNWGDTTDSGWMGPYDSGIECAISHTWETKGTYTIIIKAKDMSGHESDWSNPFEVSMQKNKHITLTSSRSQSCLDGFRIFNLFFS